MKRLITYFLLATIILFTFINLNAEKEWLVLKGPYLGQKPPGMTPEIFAPGVVSTGFDEMFTYFTPDARELYFQLWKAPFPVILVMKEENGRWTKPKVASFSGRYFARF